MAEKENKTPPISQLESASPAQSQLHEDVDGKETKSDSVNVKLDKHGLPLVPQPSDNKDDPLNWSPMLKMLVTLQVSWLAFLGPLGAAVANPAFVTLSRQFGVTPVQASYSLTMYIVWAGVGPLFTIPFANIYGRRPVYLLGIIIAAITNIVAGYSPSWAGILITRAINGIAAGSPGAIGAATICDMYFMHERGFYMGIFTLFLTNGPHIAPLIGGFAADDLSWNWCYRIPGYIQLGSFVLVLFCLPETLYSRNTTVKHKQHSFADLLLFRATLPNRKLKTKDFYRPLYMLKYLAVALPGLYYMTCFGYGSVIFATTGSQLFKQFYNFTVAQTGLMLSIPLAIGCIIGEANSGWLTDWMVRRYAKKHDGVRIPEARLDALWFALLCPIGLIIEGVCLTHFKTASWVGSAFGMGIASVGLQAATTVTYAYTTDCYKPQSPEISALMNFLRNTFSMIISFYAIPLGEKIEFQFAWLLFAMINLLFFIPFVALRWLGPKLREKPWQSPPQFHNDL